MDIWNANELINDEAIDNLTDEQVDQILAILKSI
jgi:NADH:ubiquinone oxidoreductase subunit E